MSAGAPAYSAVRTVPTGPETPTQGPVVGEQASRAPASRCFPQRAPMVLAISSRVALFLWPVGSGQAQQAGTRERSSFDRCNSRRGGRLRNSSFCDPKWGGGRPAQQPLGNHGLRSPARHYRSDGLLRETGPDSRGTGNQPSSRARLLSVAGTSHSQCVIGSLTDLG